ncbi:hypothetical protein ACI65C_012028, partial [Semiaphis heraclei]
RNVFSDAPVRQTVVGPSRVCVRSYPVSAFGSQRRRAPKTKTRDFWFEYRSVPPIKLLYCASEIKNHSVCDRERTAYDGAVIPSTRHDRGTRRLMPPSYTPEE